MFMQLHNKMILQRLWRTLQDDTFERSYTQVPVWFHLHGLPLAARSGSEIYKMKNSSYPKRDLELTTLGLWNQRLAIE